MTPEEIRNMPTSSWALIAREAVAQFAELVQHFKKVDEAFFNTSKEKK